MKEFIHYLENKGLTQATQEAYLFNVNKFLDWYHGKAIEECHKRDVLEYLTFLKETKKVANITRKNQLYALQHYFGFLLKSGTIASNPTALLKIRGANPKKLNKIFTPAQLDQFYDDYYTLYIKNFDNRHIPKNQHLFSELSRHRNYVVLGFLIYQGLVTSEFDRLTLADIDFLKATVKVRGRIQAKDRTLPLVASQIGALMYYLQNIRPQFLVYQSGGDSTNEYGLLFFTLPVSGRKGTQTVSVEGIFKPLTKQVRTLAPNFTKIQQLRASRITQWLKTEGLRKTQYLAGHKSIVSTEAYLPNDLEQLTNDISQFNPF